MDANSSSRFSQQDVRGEDVYEHLQQGRSDYLDTQKQLIRSRSIVHPGDGHQVFTGHTTDISEASTDVRLADWSLMRSKWDHSVTWK